MSGTADPRRALVARVPQPEQSAWVNFWLREYRNNNPMIAATAVPSARWMTLLILVREALEVRMRSAPNRGYLDDLGKLERWRAAILDHPDEADAFAQWCVEWENLPREERERQKTARGEEHRREWMAQQSPSAAQVRYCRSLGWAGEITSKQHASEIIDQLKARRAS